MPDLKIATRDAIDALIAKREGETKLGENVKVVSPEKWDRELHASSAKYVLLGIPEDIGVRANHGVGGAHTAWEPALKALLNIQSTDLFSGEELLVLGAFDFNDWMEESKDMGVDQLRVMVEQIDEVVAPVIQLIVAAGKKPIVIGGGHNNCFPLLNGASMPMGGSINCINLDAHSDFRIMEGRHSGNGFRYAKEEGFLDKYAIIGLHENYNSQYIVNELTANEDIHYSLYEDIFIWDEFNYREAIDKAIAHCEGKPTGIELDLDCIERTLSSAMTPCGITPLQARHYVTFCGQLVNVAYLHLTEGATQLRDGRTDASTAKLIAYLVSDFIKGNKYYQEKKGNVIMANF